MKRTFRAYRMKRTFREVAENLGMWALRIAVCIPLAFVVGVVICIVANLPEMIVDWFMG